eukprot:182901-Prymnesium_polylepis.1
MACTFGTVTSQADFSVTDDDERHVKWAHQTAELKRQIAEAHALNERNRRVSQTPLSQPDVAMAYESLSDARVSRGWGQD